MNQSYRNLFYGTDEAIWTTAGWKNRVYLNSAATPLIAKPIIQTFFETLPDYSYGNEANQLSLKLHDSYNQVREICLNYVDGDPMADTVIYTANTTSAINHLSHILHQQDPEQIILTTRMEHMANYLPYYSKMKTVLVNLTPDGMIDLGDYKKKLEQYQGKIKLVAVTGASNITGIIPPYYTMASLAHAFGAKIFVDAVQLVQHQHFSMKPHNDPEHIDFVSFDGHKCYTGQSGGVLIGPKTFLDSGSPFLYGAGITDFVTDSKIVYKDAPERFEAGYPDFLGIISLGKALHFLAEIGMAQIICHESMLQRYLSDRLAEIPGVIVYEPEYPFAQVPFLSFNLNGMPFQELANQLGFHYGIVVGAGTNGANLYVQDLLGLSNQQAEFIYQNKQSYGIVRVSLGLFNSTEDINDLIHAIEEISICNTGRRIY